jgi:uncharacterized protein YqeY
MSQKIILRNALKESMKAKDQLRTDTIRSLLSAFQYLEMEKGVEEISAEDSLVVLQREGKKRREEIEFAEKAARIDSIPTLERELAIIEEFLPKQLSRDELTSIIVGIKEKSGSTNLGEIMKILKESHGGSYDGKIASEVARHLLAG